MSGERHEDERPAADSREGQEDQGGQVSEVGNLDDAGEIFPGDATAGYPLDDDEGGDVQEGAAGPNARTGDEPHGGDQPGKVRGSGS